MKIITTLFIGFFTATCFAQLTVKPNGTENNYIYVKGEVLYVEEDINLVANTNDPGVANIYLRHEGQLIQGRTDASQNSGTGVLSVFQEGVADNYAYNYWASPVGEADGSIIGNRNFGITLFHSPTSTLQSTAANIINGYNGLSSSSTAAVSIAKYWIWKFTGATDYADWAHVGNMLDVETGLGFSMKGVSGSDATDFGEGANNPGNNQRYDFRGRPNDGTISINLIPGQNYLVGNPYPSALDLSYFLLENSTDPASGVFTTVGCTDNVTRRDAITGVAYFWDSNPAIQSHNIAAYEGGYETFAPVDCSTTGVYTAATFHMYDLGGNSVGTTTTGSGSYNRRYSPIGQGFFVESSAAATAGSLEFKNTHRIFEKETGGNSEFHRMSEENSTDEATAYAGNQLEIIPKLRLNIEFNGQYTRQMALAFWPTATNDVDAAMDAKNADAIASDAGWLHNDENYVIDVRQFDIEQQIPLFLQVTGQKTIKFRVNTGNFENFDVENVYILDKLTQMYHPIKDQTFTIVLSAGNYNDRFKLTFLSAEDQANMDVEEVIADTFDVFQNNSAGQLEIRNPKNAEIKSVALYDLTGKQIFGQQNVGTDSMYSFPTANMQEAIYVVKITTADNKETAKKVSIINRN